MGRILTGAAVVLVVALAVVWLAGRGVFGSHEAPGEPSASVRSSALVSAVAADEQRGAAGVGVSEARQILFGDLHVHTTFSTDAFMLSLPTGVGQGAHPPADACDFARHCSALDFWSINDHAEALTPRHWAETVEAIRQCNDVAGDPANPDTVAYLGWEWTNVGARPENHYGHKNVVLLDTADGEVPARPIAASGRARDAMRTAPATLGMGVWALASGESRIHDLARYIAERRGLPECARGVPVRELPDDCQEFAYDPTELFAKLDDWGFESIVIPHGTTWGFYTPPGSTWDKQLVGAVHDPDRQRLMEVYSGHGDSEVYRPWRAVRFDADGNAVCPNPTRDYLPTCWRAGEIIRERCLDAGESDAECEARAVAARAHAAAAGAAAHLTVPGEKPEEWLDAGQCRDCRQPAFNYRPGGSAQYVLALGSFEDGAAPRHFRMGLMAASDNHFARPGTGYKEVHRLGMAEASATNRPRSSFANRILRAREEPPRAKSQPFDPDDTKLRGFQLVELERQSSFFGTGGLIAVHSEGRSRRAIWQALERREVYGTSGPRILLWFDLLNPPGSRGATAHMGSAVAMDADPVFQVRAVGSFEQKPGCPEDALRALGPERLDQVCMGECYHPSDTRRPITRIEIVRIRPQTRPDEDIAGLIDDPWQSFACAPAAEGCVVTFSDPDYARSGRDALYYARVFEPPKPTINGANVRCDRGPDGDCRSVELCMDDSDECLAPVEPRAWSSPIWVDRI